MNGLEAVELRLSEVEKGLRIDAELYQKHFVLFHRKLNKLDTTTLEREALVVKKGIFDIRASNYVQSGIPFVRIGNLKSMLIDDTDIIYISEEENQKNKETSLQRNDIILSKTANAAASLVNLDVCNTSQDTVAVKLKPESKLLSHYVVVYLNTESGLKEMQRWFTGNIQMHLNLTDCKSKMLIPVLSRDFQRRITGIFEESIEISRQASENYNQAESILLDELGLHNWQPSDRNTEVKSFKNAFLQSGRLDAEYYQPKYDEVEAAIINNAEYYKKIGDIKTFNARGLQPVYVGDGNLNVVNSKHILEKTLDYNNFEKTEASFWEIQSRAQIHRNDILTYTTGANIGRTQTYLSDERALASNHVNILRITKEENPIYVAFVMNSILGRLQTEKLSAGSAQQELYPKDIDKFLIPFVIHAAQEAICANVLQSLELQRRSHRLLETAKQAVEIAIEQNEEAAIQLINQNF